MSVWEGCVARLWREGEGERFGELGQSPAGGGGKAVLECEGVGKSQPACGGLGWVFGLSAVGLV
jgi:hypothetical protein